MRPIPRALVVLATLALAACTIETPPSPGGRPSPGVIVPPSPGPGPGSRPGGGTPGAGLPPAPGSPGTGVPPSAGTPAGDLPGTPVPPSAGADACGASGYQHLVGRDVAVVRGMTFPGPMRVLHPDDAITMEFSPRRINFIVSAAGRIEEITCG